MNIWAEQDTEALLRLRRRHRAALFFRLGRSVQKKAIVDWCRG